MLRADYAFGFARAFEATVGLRGGAALRRIPILAPDGEEARLGGLWLGAALGIVYDGERSR